jgi:hypothetical protein
VISNPVSCFDDIRVHNVIVDITSLLTMLDTASATRHSGKDIGSLSILRIDHDKVKTSKKGRRACAARRQRGLFMSIFIQERKLATSPYWYSIPTSFRLSFLGGG